MSQLKPSSHGIVVDHKETGIRYAISDHNYSPKVHEKVRDLKPGESVRTYQPRTKDALSSPKGAQDATGSAADSSRTTRTTSDQTTNHTK